MPSPASDPASFDALCYYTLAHGDPSYVHQYVVDAFGAQTANDTDKPIRLAFSLVGLYLHIERAFTGRQVQLAHMELARRKQQWPRFPLPRERGAITVQEVLAAPPGLKRDRMIDAWCGSVWAAFGESRVLVVQWLAANGIH